MLGYIIALDLLGVMSVLAFRSGFNNEGTRKEDIDGMEAES